MKRVWLVAAMLVAVTAAAQDAPQPEQCVAKPGDASAVTVSYGGKTYHLANDACRTQFLGDPERYAQLYDALEELAREGAPLQAPAKASLVPS